MRSLHQKVQSAYAWLKVDSEEGVAAIEYGLLAALIAVGIATAVAAVGSNLTDVFNFVATKVHS
jgi:pilus assembly protein Flp/PilA